MIDWDDLKYFLVMAEEGSLTGAANRLHISQPTLSRRLTALEHSTGIDLFTRTRSGLELTAAGEGIIHSVKHMQDDVHAIERIITGQDDSLKGRIAISTAENIGSSWLVDQLRPFHDQYPSIEIEIKIDNSVSDLLRREADIALRMFRPEQNDLIARKTVTMNYGFYASKDYVAKHGLPKSKAELKTHNLVLPHEDILQMVKRTHKDTDITGAKAAFRSNSLSALEAAIRAGYGIGTTCHITASQCDDLVPVLPDYSVYSADIWLVTHSELRRSARLRLIYDYLADMLMKHKTAFMFPADHNKNIQAVQHQ